MAFSIQAVYNWYTSIIRNPKYRWWVIIGTFAYIFSPLDISPDFIPFIGQIDDVALVTLLVAELSQQAIGFFKNRQNGDETTVADAVNTGEPVEVNVVDI
ncbi:MAG: YkvA family protein, partial [Microcoleaceae cyanobacterium]